MGATRMQSLQRRLLLVHTLGACMVALASVVPSAATSTQQEHAAFLRKERLAALAAAAANDDDDDELTVIPKHSQTKENLEELLAAAEAGTTT